MASDPPFDSACEFCAISRGISPNMPEVVARGDGWIAFSPKAPAVPGHILLIPDQHVPDFLELDSGTAAMLAIVATSLGNAIRRTLEPDGMNLITSSGEAAEQSVRHLHIHLVPRWEEDDFGKIWPETGASDCLAIEDAIRKIRDNSSEIH